MFHISNISGSQSPYTPEILRELQTIQASNQALTDAVSENPSSAIENSSFEISSTDDALENAAINTALENEAALNEIGSRTSDVTAGPALSNYTAIGLAAASTQKGADSANKLDATAQSALDAKKKGKVVIPTQPIASIQPLDEHELEVELANSQTQNQAAVIFYGSSSFTDKRMAVITAQQLMSTPVESLGPEDLVRDVLKKIFKKRFRHVPITNSNGQLVGIMSDRDFILEPNNSQLKESASKTKIKDKMATNVLTARPETEVRLIARVMIEEGVGAMPIVNSEERLIGILTSSDILRAIVNLAQIELRT